MSTAINKISTLKETDNAILLTNKKLNGLSDYLSKTELAHVQECAKKELKRVSLNQLKRQIFIEFIDDLGDKNANLEKCRNVGNELVSILNATKVSSVTLVDLLSDSAYCLAYAEGIALGNYQFLHYFTDKKKLQNSLNEINIFSKKVTAEQIKTTEISVESVCIARDLVNHPVSYLNAVQYAEDISALGKQAGFNVEVLNKKKIESLKMGGLLAVNFGSTIPPTFTIMEWKPKGVKNKKPIVFVGKGIVYDTGGLSLKPTPNSMDLMKSDMGGSAAVVGAMYAIAKAKLPVHVVGLVPATDNRPGLNAYAPGDVITMFDGTTVEVMNTDAEGRLVLADALTYAKKYKPQLVIDLATLTGAAVRAIGTRAIVSMGNATKEHQTLERLGATIFERLAPQPFWDDYAEELKSPIADLKNLGSDCAGQITAGKFLEHFTNDKKGKSEYPWLHLDIAGPAFLTSPNTYRKAGGTGVGVRLLFEYIKTLTT